MTPTSFEEITAWTVDDVISNTTSSLPLGWKFEQGCGEGGVWFARILRPVDGESVVEWEEWGVDRKLLLLDAYGWLIFHLRPHTLKSDSPWGRRQEIEVKAVTRRAQAGFVPGDLDPDEIASVYSKKK